MKIHLHLRICVYVQISFVFGCFIDFPIHIDREGGNYWRERIGDTRETGMRERRTGNSGFRLEGANLLVRPSVYPVLNSPQSSRLPGQFPRIIRSPRDEFHDTGIVCRDPLPLCAAYTKQIEFKNLLLYTSNLFIYQFQSNSRQYVQIQASGIMRQTSG